MDVPIARRGFDVMGENERPGVVAWPGRERWHSGTRHPCEHIEEVNVEVVQARFDGPTREGQPPLKPPQRPAEAYLDAARKEWPRVIVGGLRECSQAPTSKQPGHVVRLAPEAKNGLVGVKRQKDIAVAIAPDRGNVVARMVFDRVFCRP